MSELWEQQKEQVRAKLSEEKTRTIYRQHKINVESVFGFLKANLHFTQFSVRGKSMVIIEGSHINGCGYKKIHSH